MAESKDAPIDVSLAMTVHNAAEWLEECLHSILAQTFTGRMELSIFNDASTDTSMAILEKLRKHFDERGIKIVISSAENLEPKGVGYGSNCAIRQSTGRYICIQDGDDTMMPDRVAVQYATAQDNPNAIIGSCFNRIPEGSTKRYTRWCNTLTPLQLYTQAFTAFGPTIVKPTWFFAREVFERAGPFSEEGKGTPEDLLFFYKHLSIGGGLVRVDLPLLTYRYHPCSTTHTIHRETIWCLRVKAIEEFVLAKWKYFTIWNAGKQGRRLFRSLTQENQNKVIAFCDVDIKKITKGYYTYEQSMCIPKPRVSIIHYADAKPPLLLCVKWDLTEGEFEKNLKSLNLIEGEDYYHFS